MANKFAVFTISMFGIISALSVWSSAWAKEGKEESKGTVGYFFKSFGKRMKENAEGTNNRISDEYSDAQQQIFKVNDGSMYHCVANPEGKFYAPGKARYGHTAHVNKKLVFVDDSAQQVGNKLRIDLLKSISGGDCAKLMQAGKLVRLDGPEGAAATSTGDQGRNTEIVGYRWEFANHKCRAKRDTKGNITVSPRGTELTLENCERVQTILDQSEEAYKNGDKATSQRLRKL